MIAAGSYSTGRKTALNGKIDKMGTRMIVQRKTLYWNEMNLKAVIWLSKRRPISFGDA